MGYDQDAADLALELRLWSKEIALCTNGGKICSRAAFKQLQRNGVKIIRTPIARLEGTGQRLKRIVFQDGSTDARRALFFSPGQHQRSPLAEMLGCKFCSDTDSVLCKEDASTCVPGVYVVGNASKGVQLIIAAAAEGMRAGLAINDALLEADARRGAVKSGAGDEKHPAPMPA